MRKAEITKIKQYRYLIYHLRWQVSAIVMMPVLYLLDRFNLALWASLMLSQCFGAFIFWYIDWFIFTGTRPKFERGRS
jgi:hypothetical protein